MLNAKSTRCKRLTQTFPAGVLTVFYVDIRFERVVFDNDVLYGVRIAVDDQVSPEDTCGYLQLRWEKTLAWLIPDQLYRFLLLTIKRNFGKKKNGIETFNFHNARFNQ